MVVKAYHGDGRRENVPRCCKDFKLEIEVGICMFSNLHFCKDKSFKLVFSGNCVGMLSKSLSCKSRTRRLGSENKWDGMLPAT